MKPPDDASGQLRFTWSARGGRWIVSRGAVAPVKARERWTWGPYVVRPCLRCGCTPERPCAMQLPDGVSEAECVPAGAYGFRACSRCLCGMPLAGELAVDHQEQEASG